MEDAEVYEQGSGVRVIGYLSGREGIRCQGLDGGAGGVKDAEMMGGLDRKLIV